jgi:hypothetical protein
MEGANARNDRRAAASLSRPSLSDLSSKIGSTVSASSTPHISQQGPTLPSQLSLKAPASRRGSPPSGLDLMGATTRSVPATPLGLSNPAGHLSTNPGTPDLQTVNGRLITSSSHALDGANTDLQASLSRAANGQYENNSLNFSSVQAGLDEHLQVSRRVALRDNDDR